MIASLYAGHAIEAVRSLHGLGWMTHLDVGAEPTPMAQLILRAPGWILLSVGLLITAMAELLSERERGHVRVLACVSAVLAGLLAVQELSVASYGGPTLVASGALIADPLAALLDVLIAVAAASAIAMVRIREPGSVARSRVSWQQRPEVPMLAAAWAASTAAHATNLIVLLAAFELLSISLAVAVLTHVRIHEAREAALRALLGAFASSTVMWLGATLLFAALGTFDLALMQQRVVAVFTHWGAMQRDASALLAGEVPPAYLADARTRVFTGMAPASLFFPGMLLMLSAVVVRLGIWPAQLGRGEQVEGSAPSVASMVVTLPAIAGVTALLRVFFPSMTSARLVNEPYGWTGPLPALCLTAFAITTLLSLRQDSWARRISLLASGQVALIGLCILLAANLHGHVALARSRGLATQVEQQWAIDAAARATESGLWMLIALVIAVIGCFALASYATHDGASRLRLDTLRGVAGRRPELAILASVCLLSLVGAPPLLGGLTSLTFYRQLAAHSALSWLVIPLLAIQAIAICSALAVVSSMWLHDPPHVRVGSSGPGGRASLRVLSLLGALCVALPWSATVMKAIGVAATDAAAHPMTKDHAAKIRERAEQLELPLPATSRRAAEAALVAGGPTEQPAAESAPIDAKATPP